MGDASQYALLTTAMATGLLHTLIPDHWLPFVLIGRARNWSVRTTLVVSGLAAAIHTAMSILLGGLALLVGVTAGQLVGQSLEQASGYLLIAFGVLYAFWAWRKGGHFHPGGALFHPGPGDSCTGDEGHDHPQHLHYHADDGLIGGQSRLRGRTLALIVGANPCVLLLPIMLAAARQGGAAVSVVILAYSVPTVALMMGLSALGVAGSRRIRLPAAARHLEAASGVLIALTGLVVLIWHP